MSTRQTLLASSLMLLFCSAPRAALGQEVALDGNISAPVELYDYVVPRDGLTCPEIAAIALGDRDRYEILHQYNQFGPVPHKFKKGDTVKLPRKADEPTAKLTDRRGQVRSRPPNLSRWERAQLNMKLWRAWRLNTLMRASAEITYRDDSTLQMGDNTLVVIYGPGDPAQRRRTAQAELKHGRLRARLDQLAGKPAPRANIDTPTTEAQMREGNSLFKVEEKGGTTRVANHGGEPVDLQRKRKNQTGRPKRVAPARRPRLALQVGMGSKVKPGRDPSPPRPLPPTPQWRSPQSEGQLRLQPDAGELTIAWSPVTGATRYRVEIARAPRGKKLFDVRTMPAKTTSLQLRGLPAGEYFFTVASIDDDKFESIPSLELHRSIHEIELGLPTNLDLRIQRLQGKKPQLLPGTTLTLPEARCQLGGQPLSETLQLQRPGFVTLRCFGKTEGRLLGQRELQVLDVNLRADEGSDDLQRWGRERPQTLMLKSSVPIVNGLAIKTPSGVELRSLRRQRDGRWRAEIVATARAPQAGRLQLQLPAQREGAAPIPLASLPYQIDPRPGAAGAQALRRPWAIGLQAGMLTLFNRPIRQDEQPTDLREQIAAGLFLQRQITADSAISGALRWQRTLGLDPYDANLFDLRASAQIEPVGEQLRPLLGLGAGLLWLPASLIELQGFMQLGLSWRPTDSALLLQAAIEPHLMTGRRGAIVYGAAQISAAWRF